jgi:hypothetical protein
MAGFIWGHAGAKIALGSKINVLPDLLGHFSVQLASVQYRTEPEPELREPTHE